MVAFSQLKTAIHVRIQALLMEFGPIEDCIALQNSVNALYRRINWESHPELSDKARKKG